MRSPVILTTPFSRSSLRASVTPSSSPVQKTYSAVSCGVEVMSRGWESTGAWNFPRLSKGSATSIQAIDSGGELSLTMGFTRFTYRLEENVKFTVSTSNSIPSRSVKLKLFTFRLWTWEAYHSFRKFQHRPEPWVWDSFFPFKYSNWSWISWNN